MQSNYYKVISKSNRLQGIWLLVMSADTRLGAIGKETQEKEERGACVTAERQTPV